jgi:sugar/nucleoside kinase (ribokinase family)
MDVVKNFKKTNGTISIDTNWDPSENWDSGILDILPMANIFFPNENELKLITKENDLMTALKKASTMVDIVAVKLGKGGAIATDGKNCYKCGIIDSDVKDTIGAGDSFDGGFLYAYLSGMVIPDALKIAALCGSLNTTEFGGIKGQPTLEKLKEYLETYDIPVEKYDIHEVQI